MNNTQTNIFNNVSEAIIWSSQKYFDKNFQGITLAEEAVNGLDSVVAKYQDFFSSITEISTQDLPSEATIMSLFNGNIALVSEEYFITGKDGVVKTNNQIFSAKQLIQILQDKKVYLVTK